MSKHSIFPPAMLRTSFIRIDLVDKFSHVSRVDREGDLLEESRLLITQPAFRRKFADLTPGRVVVEVGNHSR